jgi:hypothetical protein
MKKIAGLMMVLTAGAALAMPAMARDRDDYVACAPAYTYAPAPVYAPYARVVVRHDDRDRHEVRRVVTPVRREHGRR